ncbi:MAG TPA: GNAT family N-acetyltransferase [Syntrophobacteraceae bacterium]|nr:GNAT family N-acetyltransferase [Syntrophobacteraceae bacterium]
MEDVGPRSGKSRVRRAVTADLDSILDIEEGSFPSPWNRDYFQAALKDLFLVFEAESVQGFLVACAYQAAKKALILKVAVHPEHRGKGIASELLRTAVELLKTENLEEVELDVDVFKSGAMRLYERFGFRVVTCVSTDPEENDAFCVMKRRL